MTPTLDTLLNAALSARRTLMSDAAVNAYRLLNGEADGIAGLAVDRFGDVLVAQLHEGRLQASPEEAYTLVRALHERLGTRAVYRKTFVKDRAGSAEGVAAEHYDPNPWIGAPVEPEQVIVENGVRFIVRPYDGFAVGLFLEHRENRRRIRELAAGRRVLNAFAHTCGFSVAAAASPAATVASVDLSRRYLEWGKRNFAANHLPLEPHRFFCSDIFEFYKRAKRQNRRFDLIVLDPPTFSRARRPKRAFVLGEQLERLCAGAVELLDPGGVIFVATNDRQIPLNRLESALTAAAPGRRCTMLERPGLPLDFAGDPHYVKTVIARFD